MPAFCSASMMRAQASAVGARGFSQKTYLPALRAAITSGSWAGPKLQIITASTSFEAMSSAELGKVVAPIRSATFRAFSALRSVTATTRPPAMTL